MIQDIAPHHFSNQFMHRALCDGDFVLRYRQGTVAARLCDGVLCLPEAAQLCPEARQAARYGFSIDGAAFFLVPPDTELAEPWEQIPTAQCREALPQETAFACGVGESLARWYENTRFCGRCGGAMRDSETERARVCDGCGAVVYPKICPAVIAAVTDGDRLLLTKYRGRPFRRYALVAGFNEIGESIEDTVRREVLEETGLRVKNLRFYRSQPWVFTDSLLMGFFCDLDGSDTVRLQEDELAEGVWFERSVLPTDHSGISLTGEMIEAFRRGQTP